MEQSDHIFSDNEKNPDNEAQSPDALSPHPLSQRIRRRLGAVYEQLAIRDGDLVMGENQANGQVLPPLRSRRGLRRRQTRLTYAQPEVCDLTPEDMAKESFLAAMREAEPWRAVAADAIDPGILDVTESVQEYMRSDEGRDALNIWHATLHGSFEGDLSDFEDWIVTGRKFGQEEVEGLLRLVDLIEGWVKFLHQTLASAADSDDSRDP